MRNCSDSAQLGRITEISSTKEMFLFKLEKFAVKVKVCRFRFLIVKLIPPVKKYLICWVVFQ